MMFALSFLICGSLFLAIRYASTRWKLSPEIQRKLAHVLLGVYSLSLPWIFSETWQVFLLCSLVSAGMIGLRLSQSVASKWYGILYSVGRVSYGEIFFCISVAVLFAIAHTRLELYELPLVILTLADAAAALVGVHYGQIRYAIDHQTKSWEGTITFFLLAWLLSLIVLILLSPAAHWTLILSTLIVAIFATVLEAISWRGLDNLFIPFGVFLLLENLLKATNTQLFLYLTVLIAAFISAGLFARITRLSRLTLWTVILALFFIYIDGSWQNTILPVLLACLIFVQKEPNQKRTSEDYLPELSALIGPAIACFLIYRILNFNTAFLFSLSYLLQIAVLLVGLERNIKHAGLRLFLNGASFFLLLGILAIRDYYMPAMHGDPAIIMTAGATILAVIFLLCQMKSLEPYLSRPQIRMAGCLLCALPVIFLP
jgi:dolichol kinase